MTKSQSRSMISLAIRFAALGPGLLGLVLAAAPEVHARDQQSSSVSVQITRTTFNIPHIKASDYRSLGYGAAYAYAQDNVCLLAETLITVRGERSRYFGADGHSSWGGPANLESDTFYRSYIVPAKVSELYGSISHDAAELVAGYAAGYNRYLSDTPQEERPESCRNANWVAPVSVNDVFLLMADKMIQGSMGSLKEAIATAAPPSETPEPTTGARGHADQREPAPPGSNGYALGRDLSAGGKGILVANPHFPWDGPNRFYEMHLTIPGRLDAMGVSILPFPAIIIGFNKNVAWTHTVSPGQRKTFYELALLPGDSTSYQYDGRPEKIQARPVSIDVLQADGSLRTVTRTTYWSRFGPVLGNIAGKSTWSEQRAYAVRDAMLENSRALDQWLAIDKADGVADIEAALKRLHGTPWVNTIAADRSGNTLYADLSIVPNVTEQQSRDCQPSEEAQAMARIFGAVILDGSGQDCDWENGEGSLQPGIMPAAKMPVLRRTDYVLNSNNSFWLANAERPLTGYASIIGGVNEPQNLRTRMGYRQLRELIAAKKGNITPTDLREMLLSDRNYAAEMVLDDILDICASQHTVVRSVSVGCAVLRQWDRRDDAASEGAVMFRELWQRINDLPDQDLWSRSFNPSNPLTTPKDLAKEKPDLRDLVLRTIGDTVDQLNQVGFDANVPLGAVQTRSSGHGSIPISGGSGTEGVLNLMAFGPLGRQGYDNSSMGGSSYIQIVTWDEDGPVARALLTYGQSSEKSSPHYIDQTVVFASKMLPKRPFSDEDVRRDRLSELNLSEE